MIERGEQPCSSCGGAVTPERSIINSIPLVTLPLATAPNKSRKFTLSRSERLVTSPPSKNTICAP